MKLVVRAMGESALAYDNVEFLAARYKAAYDAYQSIVASNVAITLDGERPSLRAVVAEEVAFERLDVARYALLDAAALAFPTLH